MVKAKVIGMFEVAKISGWPKPESLLLRPPAEKMRPTFRELLYNAEDLIVELDFSGIEVQDGSFVDELIVKELSEIKRSGSCVMKY